MLSKDKWGKYGIVMLFMAFMALLFIWFRNVSIISF